MNPQAAGSIPSASNFCVMLRGPVRAGRAVLSTETFHDAACSDRQPSLLRTLERIKYRSRGRGLLSPHAKTVKSSAVSKRGALSSCSQPLAYADVRINTLGARGVGGASVTMSLAHTPEGGALIPNLLSK